MTTTKIDPKELEEDLKNILRKVAEVKGISNYELIPDANINVGDGFVAQFFTGQVRNKDNGEIINVAIKKSPTYDFDFSNVFKNEEVFYSTIFPVLDEVQKSHDILNPFKNVPTFYCAGNNKKKEFIAMEFLKPDGYILFDKKKYFDKDHLEYIFELYGRFHALSFVLRKQNPEKYEEIHRDINDIFKMVIDWNEKQIRESIVAALESLDPNSAAYRVLKHFPENLRNVFLNTYKYKGDYRCSTHGDSWSNNMLFKYSESGKLEDIKLIDYQLARDGTPIHDLSYFFYSGACKTDIDNLEYYLKIYHNSLSKFIRQLDENPEDIYPFEILIKEWKENAILGVIMAIFLWQIKLGSKEEFSEILLSTGQSLEELEQSFNKVLQKTFESDEFKERSSAILLHAFDYGIITEKCINIHKEENAVQ